jgi:tripartite-type tricarboxylate transporter receptor subunit TctC
MNARMHGSRRRIALASPRAFGAAAQDFPTSRSTVVVGFRTGGSNDQVARIIAPEMAKALGQPWSIENQPGANATLGHRLPSRRQLPTATPSRWAACRRW